MKSKKGGRMASEYIYTHILGLDEKMEGGIPKGYIILISGPPGSYKSSIAFYIAYKNMLFKEEGKVLYLTLSQNKESLISQMEEMNLNLKNLPKGTKFEIINGDFLREGGIKNIDDFIALMEKYRERWENMDFLIVDHLNFLYLYTIMRSKDAVMDIVKLFEFMRKIGATTFLISETPWESNKLSQFEIEPYLCDGIFHLNMERIGRTLGRYISVIKLRGRKHSTDYYPLVVDDMGFRILTH